MTKAKMRKVYDALVIAWAYSKTDYEIAVKDYGKDSAYTEIKRKDYEAAKEALTIINAELGLGAKEL